MSGTQSLPEDFDPDTYLALNPDVGAAGADPQAHFATYGMQEGRPYARPHADRHAAGQSLADAINFHPPRKKAGGLGLATHPAVGQPNSNAIAERLIESYRYSVAHMPDRLGTSPADLWTGAITEEMKQLIQRLDQGDPQGVTSFMLEFGTRYTWFGGVTTGIDGFSRNDVSPERVAFSYYDKLVCLAEAVGVLPLENPEQAHTEHWGNNAAIDPDHIRRLLEERIGFSLAPPLGIMPVTGLAVGTTALHYRHINAVYAALRVAALTSAGDAVCEYGGGLGFIPIYLARFAQRRYVLLDLPLVNVLSGYVLAHSLGEQAVTFEGEDGDGPVFVTAGWNCFNPPIERFSLSFNQDSFPEIDRTIVSDYTDAIHRNTDGHFLSINHEAGHSTVGSATHVPVADALDDDPRFVRVYRMPYWLRRGYVEELWRLTPTAASSPTP